MASFSSHPLRVRKAFVCILVGAVLELLGFLHHPMWTSNHVAEGFAVTGLVAEILAVIVLVMYIFFEEYRECEKSKLIIALLTFFGAIFMIPGAAIPNPPSNSPVPLSILVLGIIINIIAAAILFLEISNINFDALYQGILAQRQALRQRRTKKNKVHCERRLVEEKVIATTATVEGESENTVLQITNETTEEGEPNMTLGEEASEDLNKAEENITENINESEKNGKNALQESSSGAQKNSQSQSNQEVSRENNKKNVTPTVSGNSIQKSTSRSSRNSRQSEKSQKMNGNASPKISEGSMRKTPSRSSRNSRQSQRSQRDETGSGSPILDLTEIRQVTSLTDKQSRPVQENTSKDNVKTGSDIDVMIQDS